MVTGATGFLGTWICRWLLENTGDDLIVPIRGPRGHITSRLERAWWDWPTLREEMGERIRPIGGDVIEQDLGLSKENLATVRSEVSRIIHSAALVWFDRTGKDMKDVNVLGTRNVIDLARSIASNGDLERLSHVSTAYVAGMRTGRIEELHLDDRAGFNNDYERSKYQAEVLVSEAARDLPISIFRPGMIVGDTERGWVRSFNTLYQPLRLYLTGGLRVLPVKRDMPVNMVPVDYVASSIASMTSDPRGEGVTFHLTPSPERMPTVGGIIKRTREWCQTNLDLRLPRPIHLPMPMALTRRGLGRYASLAPYLNEGRTFLRDNSERLLGEYDVDWEGLLDRMLEFATYHGFMHRSDRTVHQQVLFRMGSRSRPVRYRDIGARGKEIRESKRVKEEVIRATSALASLGIGPGDRVAMVGQNSTRYLVLDLAIGLRGAVSVPLYFTSPPSEIGKVVEHACSRMLFIGTKGLIERLDRMDVGIRSIYFGYDQHPPGVMGWEEFLSMGSDTMEEVPISPNDPATLRYTSSTTGDPKGVEFTHAHLRWMAEAVVSLFPWTARNSPVSYLSFLPMNHVVEGILGNYSPYFAPAPLDIAFLEDIHGLPEALREVRPTILFSVPRFYEKIWERFEETPQGGRYAVSGRAGGIRTWILRRAFLRRAGLDRCAQMIVGSAPSSINMLERFRSMGIEVHNAYGLTEAPLVTLNRVGRNRIDTVGEPLPETEISISDEGEVLVKGPQVMSRYMGDEEQPFIDGWLRTGDEGSIDEGHLRIEGRIKEVMVTSYGKNIQPMKVEGAIRSIVGVEEAMLVCEGRPFCTAIIWVKERLQPEERSSIDKAIKRINRDLSRPERVKRWVVLPYDLSIHSGELTANLKIRRSVVSERLQEWIERLYSENEDDDVGRDGEA